MLMMANDYMSPQEMSACHTVISDWWETLANELLHGFHFLHIHTFLSKDAYYNATTLKMVP